VDRSTKDLDDTRAAAALKPDDAQLAAAVKRDEVTLKEEEAWLKGRVAWLKGREAWLTDREEKLAEVRAAAAGQRVLESPAEFPRVLRIVALQQLGALARSKRFEVPTQVLEDVERHVHTLRDLFGQRLDQSKIPNLAVAATAGAGKTTLLRYLQQTTDTFR
jgi:hypothetical protein